MNHIGFEGFRIDGNNYFGEWIFKTNSGKNINVIYLNGSTDIAGKAISVMLYFFAIGQLYYFSRGQKDVNNTAIRNKGIVHRYGSVRH